MPSIRRVSVLDRRFGLLAALAVPSFLLGCKDATTTGPNNDAGGFPAATIGGVDFPAISGTDANTFCIRDRGVPPVNFSGSISLTDCDYGEDEGFWDAYHIRVATSTSVTFTVDSDFDSWLDLIQVGDASDVGSSLVQLDFDDDSGPGLDAMLTYTLDPGTDYAILVSGFDDSQVGPYTLLITTP